MKRLFSLVASVIVTCLTIVHAQVRQINDTPLYAFGGRSGRGIARFYEPDLTDSLRVLFTVNVIFECPLSERVDKIKVSSVQVLEMTATCFLADSAKPAFILKSDDKARNEWGRDFWARYSRYIEDWYRRLPYEKMQYAGYYGLTEMKFTGVFVVTPLLK